MDGSVRRFSLDTWMLTLDSVHWTRDAGPWTLDPGFWILDSGRYILDAGLSHWDCLWLFYRRIIIQFLILLDFFFVRNRITLQTAILHCSEAPVLNFFRKIMVVEYFFWSNYRLTVQSSNYMLKWFQQECCLGSFPLRLFKSSCPVPSIFGNFSRKYRW